MVKKKPVPDPIRILQSCSAEVIVKLVGNIYEISRPPTPAWLVSHGFSDGLVRAVQIAIAELGWFANSADVGTLPMDNIRELLQTCVDRRSWRAQISKPLPSVSTVDRQRLQFFLKQKDRNRALRYKNIADLWCRENPGDTCDEGAFKQSCYRARKSVTT